MIQIELEFGNVGFCGEGKTGVPGEKTSRSKEENQQQKNPTYEAESGNRTRHKLVGGERSHHCAIPAPLAFYMIFLFSNNVLIWCVTTMVLLN